MEAERSWAEAYRKSWCEMIRAFIKFNLTDDVEVVSHDTIKIKGNDFKVDINNYTGSTDKYIFLNPSNGRMVIESNGKQKVYKFEIGIND
jgi:hypothetical protein